MLERVRLTIQRFGLIPPDSRLVIGVSGGTDSLALLHILSRLAPWLGCYLHVATLDHGLRAEAGLEDARFVERIAHDWDIPVTVGHISVPELARQTHQSLEATARRARYDFLASTARQVGANRVAVAHHADDQAETVLLRLVRGAGLTGLSGMARSAPLPGHADLLLIRPLLDVSRSDLEAYCREFGLTAREDASNQDTTLARNYVRLEIMPRLHRLNPQVHRALSRFADIAAVDEAYLDERFRQLVTPQIGFEKDRVSMNRDMFRMLHPALQRRFMLTAVHHLVGRDHPTSHLHIVEATDLALRGDHGAVGLLGGGARLRLDYDHVVIERESTPEPKTDWPLLPEGIALPVAVPGSTMLPEASWVLEASSTPLPETAHLVMPEASSVWLRTRQKGDRFAPLGLGGHSQKVSRWMINRKIPLRLRARIPLLTIDGQVAAIVVGAEWTISEYFRVRNDSNHIVYFRFRLNL